MLWILIAVVGHMANGVAFVVDKILLKNAFKHSATYAGLVGLLSALSLVLIPWVEVWPSGGMLLIAILSGVTFMAALWTFFTALSLGEATRVVPIISALIPVLTLLGTWLFLDERLTGAEMLGFALLIFAMILLASGKGNEKLRKKAILLSLISAAMFAITSVTGKAVYNEVGFLSGFVTTRITATLTSVLLVMLLDPGSGAEILEIFRSRRQTKKQIKAKGEKIKGSTAALLAILGQIMGGIGYIGVQYATSLGSAALVNALQVMQFALLVLAAFLLKDKAQALMGETLNKNVMAIKGIALLVMAAGLALIVR